MSFDNIVSIIVPIMMNIIMALNVFLLLEVLFGLQVEENKKYRRIFTVMGCTVVNIAIVLLGVNAAGQFVVILLTMFLGAFYLSGFSWRILLYVIPAILIDAEFTALLALMDRFLLFDKFGFWMNGSFWSILETLADVILICLLLFFLYLSKKRSIKVRLSVGETIIITLFCIFYPIFQTGMDAIIQNSGAYQLMLGWTVFVIIINIALFYGAIHRNIARNYKNLSIEYKSDYETVMKGAMGRRETKEEDIRIGHDMKNHFIVVNELIAGGEYERAKKYLTEIKRGGYSVEKRNTGYGLMDILLAACEERIGRNEIELDVIGDISQLAFLEDVDFTTLVSNLLDNAIEACEKLPEGIHRYIKVQAVSSGDMVMLSVKNSADKPNGADVVMCGDGQDGCSKGILSDKKKGRIGIGTQQIKRVVEKYSGSYEITYDSGEYTTQILFYK